MKSLNESIYRKIRSTRRRLEISQEYMALKLGITQSTYSKIENGDSKLSIQMAIQIAEILELKLEDFSNT